MWVLAVPIKSAFTRKRAYGISCLLIRLFSPAREAFTFLKVMNVRSSPFFGYSSIMMWELPITIESIFTFHERFRKLSMGKGMFSLFKKGIRLSLKEYKSNA